MHTIIATALIGFAFWLSFATDGPRPVLVLFGMAAGVWLAIAARKVGVLKG